MKFALGLCLIFLTACVSQNTVLMNERGQTVHCQNWGVGIIGAPLAYAEHQDCVKKAKEAGYTEPGPLPKEPEVKPTKPAVGKPF